MTPKESIIEVRDNCKYATDPRQSIAQLASAFVDFLDQLKTAIPEAIPEPEPVPVPEPVPEPEPIQVPEVTEAATTLAESSVTEANPRDAVQQLAAVALEVMDAAEKQPKAAKKVAG